MKPKTVGVIGLGKLGLPFALVLSRAGFETLVYDVDKEAAAAVHERRSHIKEPLVQELLSTWPLEFVKPTELARRASIIFVVVPTPSTELGDFDDEHVLAAIQSLGKPPTARRRIVSVVSTVSPGHLTAKGGIQITCQRLGYRVTYTPTLIALGSVIRDLTQPDVMLLGSNDVIAAEIVSNVLRAIAPGAPIDQMNLESAAIAKLASNVFVTMKIGFANALARMCDRYGGDVDSVTDALGRNERIGPKSLRAGAGFGGPCFPRDARAFAAAGGELGDAVHKLNDTHLEYVVNRVLAMHGGGFTYSVLGRNYKEGSDYRIESFGDRIDAALYERGMRPAATVDADVVIIAQPLHTLNVGDHLKRGAFVYDLWRTHTYLAQRDDIDIQYEQLGANT